MTKSVYQLIAAVSADIAAVGIQKNRRNQQQGYQFRGIDDVYNALAVTLSRHGLVIMPRVLSRCVTERASQKGGILFYVTVECEYDFVSAHDGSKHTVKTFGEAMDSADKATNKAMSAAYKYACLQAFCIPTEGDNDAENNTHELWQRSSVDTIAEYIAYEAIHLDALREAAMSGEPALAAAFKALSGPYKARLWKTHGNSLKAAAKASGTEDGGAK